MWANLRTAIFAALVTGVVVAPVFGVPITRGGINAPVEVNWAFIFKSMALVFVAQLIKPWLFSRFRRRDGGKPLFTLPSLSDTPRRIFTFVLIGVAMVWPLFAGRAETDIATLVLIYVMLGLGLNIVVGYAGLLDLGFVGFYAIGAYTYAMMFHWLGIGFWWALPCAGLAAGVFGYLLGFPVLRLRGDYLAIVTLGFGEIIRLLVTNLHTYTGGPDGISGIPKPTVFGYAMSRRAPEGETTFHDLMGWSFNSQDVIIYLYILALALALITLFVSNRLLRMPVGRAWEALREDEIACRSLGLNPTGIKLSAFTIGAVFAGFGGAFFAARQGMVNPQSFAFVESALILSIVVLGGMGSQLGVILGAILLTVLPELAREFAEYRMLLFGLAMVLMMIWRPQGLVPVKRPHVELQS